jgi:GDP-mannose 6-dehydrogenase
LHIGIMGLGYVGTTTAACLLQDGHPFHGIDINSEKARAIAEGR